MLLSCVFIRVAVSARTKQREHDPSATTYETVTYITCYRSFGCTDTFDADGAVFCRGRGTRVQYLIFVLLRGTIVNRTHGTHKNLYIEPFLLTIFGPVNYDPP